MGSCGFSKTERIIESAVHLFAQQGYHATSTREIARRAEVSENTLFRHFIRKEDLFWSALRSRAVLIAQSDPFSGSQENSPEQILPKILEVLTETVSNRSEALRLIAIAYVELKADAEAHCKELLAPFLSQISRYLADSVAKGEVINVDPSLLAASLMAMVLIHPQLARFIAANSEQPSASRGDVNAYSKFWLDVLTPRSSATVPSH
jgi:AcrR family transcriptional regulator